MAKQKKSPIKFRIWYDRDPILMIYDPCCDNFNFWSGRYLSQSALFPFEAVPGTGYLKRNIGDLDTAMLIEHIALSQWGWDGVRTFGKRPPLVILTLSGNNKYPRDTFPYDFIRNGDHPIILAENPNYKAEKKEERPANEEKRVKIEEKKRSENDKNITGDKRKEIKKLVHKKLF